MFLWKLSRYSLLSFTWPWITEEKFIFYKYYILAKTLLKTFITLFQQNQKYFLEASCSIILTYRKHKTLFLKEMHLPSRLRENDSFSFPYRYRVRGLWLLLFRSLQYNQAQYIFVFPVESFQFPSKTHLLHWHCQSFSRFARPDCSHHLSVRKCAAISGDL